MAELKYVSPGLQIPEPTAAEDGYVLQYQHSTRSLVWATASARGLSGYSGAVGAQGTSGYSGFSGYSGV